MPVSDILSQLAADGVGSRIWRRETALFSRSGTPPAVHAAIRQRLGWLDAPDAAAAAVGVLQHFARDVRADAIDHVYLLGMGGSSLGAEVLRDVPSDRASGLALTVLDTTDERAVREATEALAPERAFFLVASKSGTTIEVSALERHFWAEVTRQIGDAARSHFAAITDPDTPLAALGAERGYRRIFINPPDIGGRYSVLSLFGLVPAALLGLDLATLVDGARRMAAACQDDTVENPGLALGAFMADNALAGRDKLTLLIADEWRPLGAWIEQLVAESTGKDGRGVLPIPDEPPGAAGEYRDDRAFVAVLTPGAVHERAFSTALERAGRPVFKIAPTGAADLGGEFFRWEFATAVAGAAIGVNPFDEPNVRDAKVRTQAQLDARRATGRFRLDPPFDRRAGYLRRAYRPEAQDPPPATGPYLAILDYLPSDSRRVELVRRLRAALRAHDHIVTTHGVGPRYLHSTGQYHKGGPNTGRFVLLTAADASATPVPGTDYTFSTLKQAQALGDFDALVAAGRDVVHYHIEDPGADFSETLENLLRHL
jgi:glucose-6-phosphate isomerase